MNDDVQQIKEKLNIVEVVGQYVQLQRAGHNFRARCPFHKERTPSFMVSPERGTYICFGCGEKGDVFSFVQKIEGIDFKTALHQLAEKAGVTLRNDYVPKQEHKEHDEHLRDICEAATVFFENQLQKRADVEAYLKTRGVSDETRRAWRLGYAPASWRDVSEHLQSLGFSKDDIAEAGLSARSEKNPTEIYDRFRGRIMFPMFDAGGKVIAFSGRFFEKIEGSREEGEPAKYVNSPETPLFKKSRVLYGFDKARNSIRKADCILLVEGQFDLILAHQSGLPFTVAVSGTALTEEHLQLLGRLSKRLVLALDGDAAGVRAGLRSALMALRMGFDVKVPLFPQGKDPADLASENPELLKSAVRTSKTAIEFFLDILRVGMKDDRSYKKEVEGKVLPLVRAIQSKIDQEHFIRIVADRLRTPEDAVRSEVSKLSATAGIPDSVEGTTPLVAATPSLSRMDHALAMLLFHYEGNAAMEERIVRLAGDNVREQVLQKCVEDAERYRFEFEALGQSEEESTDLLLRSVELELVLGQIDLVRNDIRSADVSRAAELMRQLSDLKRREQELR